MRPALRFGHTAVHAAVACLMMAGLPAAASAHWIARTGLGSLGFQVCPSATLPSIQLGPTRVCYGLVSLAIGHDVIGPFGAGYSAMLVEGARALDATGRYHRFLNHGPFLSCGVMPERDPSLPAVMFFVTTGTGVDETGSWVVSGRVGLVAEWRICSVITPALEIEWSETGPSAEVSIGIGGWWTFGR